MLWLHLVRGAVFATRHHHHVVLIDTSPGMTQVETVSYLARSQPTPALKVLPWVYNTEPDESTYLNMVSSISGGMCLQGFGARIHQRGW